MYEASDPRAGLATAGSAPVPSSTAFGASTYARFYDSEPQQTAPHLLTWITRGQNFIVAYSRAEAGARIVRDTQPDEWVLLLPDVASSAVLTVGDERVAIAGHTITMVPPGASTLEITGDGQVVRLFTTRSEDLAMLAPNRDTYAGPHPHVPDFAPWPDPVGGFRIRSYSLDVADTPGRFGKIWRCTTFMVNVFPPQMGPRDPAKLSPHHHDDFEQGSLAIGGTYVHHLRWPWTANLADWRDDEHATCHSPSVCVIPPRAIHTSAAIDPGANLLVDIFSPPRADFSAMEGWVLNAADYPVPG